MLFADLTSFPQIRGVLTVSEADLPDETLAAYGLEDDLAVDLDSWAPGWAEIVDLAQVRLLRLYAKYFCAATVAATAPAFILTQMSDGSNQGQRSDADGFLWLAPTLMAKAGGFKQQLQEILGTQTGASTGFALISRVTPARDVVTEAREDAAE